MKFTQDHFFGPFDIDKHKPWVFQSRVATVREKSLVDDTFPRQGKVREFHFQSGKFRKYLKKVREFIKIPKRLKVNRLLKVIFSINGSSLYSETFLF